MSFNILLIQLVCLTCLFMVFRPGRFPKGWVIAATLNLLVLAIAYIQIPNQAGWISGSVWLVIILIPLLGYGHIQRLVIQEQYKLARRLALVLRWLHPADGMMAYPEVLKGLELAQKGQLETAAELFRRHQNSNTSMGLSATALFYRITANWHGLLAWTRTLPLANSSLRDPAFATIYLRSLGETGDLNGLLRGVEHFANSAKNSNTSTLNLVRLYALAFCGQVEHVQTLLDRALLNYPDATRQYWIATAELAAGHHSLAREHLRAVCHRSDPVQQQAIAWRLAQPALDPNRILSDESRRILANTLVAVAQEARYGGQRSFAHKAYGTYAIIAVNGGMFAIELLAGGSENEETLFRLGALVPETVIAGEGWRVLSAIFLHAGVVHLVANMLGLLFFGAMVESTLGICKFLGCYFFSGIGSMIAVTAIALLQHLPDQMTIGASGAIMGMVGVEGAILLKGWRTEKAQIAGDRLRLILVIIGLQIFSDLLTPQISVVGHLSGLILGFLAGSIVFNPKPPER